MPDHALGGAPPRIRPDAGSAPQTAKMLVHKRGIEFGMDTGTTRPAIDRPSSLAACSLPEHDPCPVASPEEAVRHWGQVRWDTAGLHLGGHADPVGRTHLSPLTPAR